LIFFCVEDDEEVPPSRPGSGDAEVPGPANTTGAFEMVEEEDEVVVSPRRFAYRLNIPLPVRAGDPNIFAVVGEIAR